MAENTSDTAHGRSGHNETLSVLEVLLVKVGFLPETEFRIGNQPLDDFVILGPKGRAYARLKKDTNPFRNWLDLQVVILDYGPQLYSIFGEVLDAASRKREKVGLLPQYHLIEGEEKIRDYLMAEWSRVKKTKVDLRHPSALQKKR